jgi:hypothetical protein
VLSARVDLVIEAMEYEVFQADYERTWMKKNQEQR